MRWVKGETREKRGRRGGGSKAAVRRIKNEQ